MRIEDTVAELVAPQVGPDVPDRVQLRAVWRQMQQGDVVGHAELVSVLMPVCAVDGEERMRAGRHGPADPGQAQVHHLGIGERQHQSSSNATPRADSSESRKMDTIDNFG